MADEDSGCAVGVDHVAPYDGHADAQFEAERGVVVNRVTADGSTLSGEYRGYAILANMGQTLGHGSSWQLVRRSASSGNILASAGNWTGLANGATNGADGYDEGTDYTLTWQITRRADNGRDIDAKMEGGNLDNDGIAQVLYTDTTPVGDDPIIGPFGS